MSKVTLPLLSVEATGALGDAVVFSRWRGINYARTYVTPSNPRTPAQTAQRNLLRFVVSAWQRMPSVVHSSCGNSARGTALTGFNLFSRLNLVVLRGRNNIQSIVLSPGQSGGVAVSSLTATPDANQIAVGATLSDVAPGLNVRAIHFVLLRDVAPVGVMEFNPVHLSDNSAPYTATFTSVPAGHYVVVAFSESARPDGSVVYGVSVNRGVTVV